MKNQQKTAKQWIQLLPEKDRMAAEGHLFYIHPQRLFLSLHEYLTTGMNWIASPEGIHYWCRVAHENKDK